MTPRHDPLGKRALFSNAEPTPAAPLSTGRKKGPFDVSVYCSSCERRSRLSAPDFVMSHLPLGAWIPWRKHSHLMKCAACGQVTWHTVSLVW